MAVSYTYLSLASACSACFMLASGNDSPNLADWLGSTRKTSSKSVEKTFVPQSI